ncbi:MAG: hypothetical protein FKY71_07990 [Spiribacter salinus]|uniref:Uncharacterized protein n=1 Tax=Spiribacter salinus TaxID=1335746 RepID=A0A540VS11_9GAMM|nr:MAG: hypothetical protein FKY71_07990 [Spiribacter salinus]
MRRALSTAAMIAIGLVPLGPQQAVAQGYQIDCAILLCLAGGWPASVPCARARAEFIRRITPWPIEPPLQIWRCPMRAAMKSFDPAQRLYNLASVQTDLSFSVPPEPETLYRTQAVGGGADIDISGPGFDFIRSIDVFQVSIRQRESNKGECNRSDFVRHGTYDANGQYHWRASSLGVLPSAFRGEERYGEHCPEIYIRAVFVDWDDHRGRYGFEQVNY